MNFTDPKKPIQAKVKAGTTGSAGAGVGGGVFIVWLYHEITGHLMDPMAAAFFAGVLGSVGAIIAGWMQKE